MPEGLMLYTFPESDWAKFSAKGTLPNSLQSLNDRVWKEWYPGEGQKYQCNGNAMLEVYAAGDMQSPDYECGIWIPLQEKVSGSGGCPMQRIWQPPYPTKRC